MLSSPAFVLAPVAVVSCPKLCAEDHPHLSCLAASACDASASTSKHLSPLISLDEDRPVGPVHEELWLMYCENALSRSAPVGLTASVRAASVPMS